MSPGCTADRAIGRLRPERWLILVSRFSYWVYQIARALQALSMGDNTRSLSEAHARTILAIESALGLDIEKALQELVMKSDMILIFFNK